MNNTGVRRAVTICGLGLSAILAAACASAPQQGVATTTADEQGGNTTSLMPAGRADEPPRVARSPFPAATPEAVVRVTNMIFPAVVRIDVAQEIYADGKRTLRRGIGSGVIIDEEGHILTNYHVAGRTAELFVTLPNTERDPAKRIGDDHGTDLAVIRMGIDEIRQKKIGFRYAALGESKTLVPGQDVMAVGTPFGLARTMTLGVVSNNERTFYPTRMTIDEYETGEFNNWIQMDTPINPGNSGGPLVDLTGKVVGINTRGGGQNLNFAVPIDTAKLVISEILASATPDKKGRVLRSDLGLDLKPMQDLETFYNIDIDKGVLINSVARGSVAEKAGVRTQDILLDLNDKPIDVRFPEQIAPARKLIAHLPIGSEVKLTLQRGRGKSSKILHLTMKTEKLEGAVGEEQELKTWGLSVRDVTRAYANENQLDDSLGVVVTTLSRGYPAAKAELTAGDVIRSVNRQPVTDLDEMNKLFNESVKRKDKIVLLEIQRGRGIQSAVLKIDYASQASDDNAKAGAARPATQRATQPSKPAKPS